MADERLPCLNSDLEQLGAKRVRDWKIESSVGLHEASEGESAISEREPANSTLKWRVMAPLERWVGTEKLLSVSVSAFVLMASISAAASTCSLVALRRDMIVKLVECEVATCF